MPDDLTPEQVYSCIVAQSLMGWTPRPRELSQEEVDRILDEGLAELDKIHQPPERARRS